MIPCVALVGYEAASVGLRKTAGADQTKTAMAAASLELLAAINVGVMVYVGHKHAVRSSGSLALFLLCTLLFDVAKSRAFFLRSGMDPVAALAAASAAMRFCLLILEELSKKNLLLDDKVREESGPEATSGFFTRLFFVYLNRMFITGFAKELRIPNMVKLDAEFSSERLYAQLKKEWDRGGEEDFSRYRLILACFRAFKWDLLVIFIPRLINIGVSFAQPFLVQVITRTAELDHDGRGDEVSSGKRGGMQGATLGVFVCLAVSKAATAHYSNKLATKVRGGLVAQLMDKAHGMSEQEARKASVLTLMSSDVESIVKGLTNFIDIPFTILEVGIGVFFLSRFIGVSCFSVLLPVLGTNIGSWLLSQKTGSSLAVWNKAIEVRIAKTTEVLHQLPSIKMLGLGPVMRDQIHRLRVNEMDLSKPFRFYMMLLNMTQQFADVGTPVVVVAFAFFWRGFGRRMTSTIVFPTLTVVNLIQAPTGRVLLAYPAFTAMLACFDRIQKFLLLPDRQDSRLPWGPSSHSSTLGQSPQSSGEIIQFSDASISPLGMDESLLTGVNFALTRGSISGVIGKTGSGKSTFFNSILGEAKIDSGYVCTERVNIAYCGPKIWLRDASVRQNVIGCLEFDAVRYEVAIRVCHLEQDLARLPGGDKYVVGPNGSNLSGGQRQRVSIARAVFAHCDVTILDDSFSSLDKRTATSILFGLCGPNGVLRASGSTVLLSTYIPEFLDVVDNLINIDEKGHVTLEDTQSGGPAQSQVITDYLNAERRGANEEVEEREQLSLQQRWNADPKPSVDSSETYRRQRGNWRLYIVLINAVGKLNSLALGGIALLLAVSEFLPPVLTRVWSEDGPEDGRYFIGYALAAVLACASAALAYWFLTGVFAVKSAVVLHEQMLDVTMRATLGFVTTTKTGNLLNRYSQDAGLFAQSLPGYFFRTIYTSIMTVIIIGIVLSSTSYMSATIPFLLAAIGLLQAFYLRTSRQMRHLDLEEKAPLYTFFCETMDGLAHLQAFGWRLENLAAGYRLLDRSQQPYYLMLAIQQWLGLVLSLLTSAIAFITVSVSVWQKNNASGSAVGLSLLALLNFQRTLIMFMDAWTISETSVAAISRLEQFKKDTPQEPRLPLPESVPVNWAPKGGVNFTATSSRYRAANDAPPALRNLSLSIIPGKKVGIIGRTGSGKSSLLLTILGFLHHEGKVEIDGINVKTLDADFLRSRVVTITQDAVLLNETVRKNLLPFTVNDVEEGLTDEQRAARASRDAELALVLGRLNLREQLGSRGGLDAMLLDVGYSKGELQLFSIARAIVRRQEIASNLVLIDEATSNLDLVRADATQQVMREAFADCTVITVAHREEGLEAVDFSIVLDGGAMLTMAEAEAAAARLFSSAAQD
ncbi:hypothetical protein PWT90_00851 [Aphanocladium album]|nr:hypothetical protein PWT90_00851 [Aphanocladium album]